MALLTNTAESGLANGTVVGTGNSGFPDAFNHVTNTQITYQAAAAQKGARGFRHAATSGVASWVGWTSVTGATNAAALRFYFRFPALPPVSDNICFTLSQGGGTGLANVVLAADGKIQLGSDPAAATLGATAAALSPNTWYRLELGLSNPSTTSGSATLRVYSGDTMTVVASLDLTGVNLGTSLIGTVRFGRNKTTASAFTYDFDDVAFQTGSATLIGASASNVAPTVNAGADQTGVEPWAPVSLTATASDPDGTTPTVTWAQSAGSPAVTLSGSGATRTFVAPGTLAGTTLTFTATASDGSLSASDSMTVTVLPVTERAVIGGVEVPMQVRNY